MKGLQDILKANGQNPKEAFQEGKVVLNKKLGCLVYDPPGINRSKRSKTNEISKLKRFRSNL